jgi:predicted ester cyclase
MGITENKAVLARFIDEIFNRAEYSHLNELLTPDYQINEAPPRASSGADGVKLVAGMFRDAFPDLWIDLDKMVAEDDAVSARCTFRGTHRGVFMGFQPTGRVVAMTALMLVHLRNGKICDSLVKNDVQALMKHLGARQVEAA